ncbi:methanogenesis marker protein 9 [Methanococcoides methylutens]|uniref:Methanogenesis marker protein 9 n=1 Tax=Methanococcoides methylutens TaxID=2226 RepID=A0A099T3N6_METMT|nr:methanogenesis marker 9 domain-containing protein [Methanococcoides methylutens]KGK98813.1 methanogenesis marker protein 9 [Methanococcoides methylutens]
MSDELFDLQIGYVKFSNPIALAPMAGVTNSEFANNYAKNAGLAVIGGYNLDGDTNIAAKALVENGRDEFITDTPLEFLENEAKAINIDGAVAFNVRSTTLEPLLKAAEIIKNAGGILELDAHCRQDEMVSIGVGEALMKDMPRLADWISKIKETGVVLSVKVRANVVDDIALARTIENAGADILHLDAMMEGAGADLGAILRVRDSTRMFLIGNNSILDFNDAKEMFSKGADMVSVSRGVLQDAHLIDHLVEEVTLLQEQMGWYNSPKHVCRGEGDLRGLAFCCLPVKPCAVHNKAGQLGYSPKEFANVKMEFAKGTPLEFGDSTCFGSLVWCCKISKPCYLRDGVLDLLDLSASDYMKLKKDLATYILDNAKKPVNES